MGYINDMHRVFIYDYKEDKTNDIDKQTLMDNFKVYEFWDKSYTYCYDFRLIPTYKLLDLKYRIPDLNNNNRRKNPGELLLSDFMSVKQIKLLPYFEYGEEKIHDVVDQIKSHQISDYWEYADFCFAKDLVHLSTTLLKFIENNPKKPILTAIEIWDNLGESDREILKQELEMIKQFSLIAARNNFSLVMISLSE